MEFDVTSIILWGGGALIGLVVLHGFISAVRARRVQPAPNGIAATRGGDQGVLPFEPVERMCDNADASPQAGTAAVEPAVGQATNAADSTTGTAAASKDATTIGKVPSIPGKRTEPTVPRHARPLNYATEEVAKAKPAADDSAMNDVLAIFAFAESGASLDGQRLLNTFEDNHLTYDGRKFVKHDPNTGRVRFMVANGVDPGNFDLSDVHAMSTPGIVLLLRMSDFEDPSDAFEDMLEVAQDFASDLGCELKDEHMSTMSGQTIEHSRQRIRDYKRMRIRK